MWHPQEPPGRPSTTSRPMYLRTRRVPHPPCHFQRVALTMICSIGILRAFKVHMPPALAVGILAFVIKTPNFYESIHVPKAPSMQPCQCPRISDTYKVKTTDGRRILPISRRSFVQVLTVGERRLLSTGVEVPSSGKRSLEAR